MPADVELESSSVLLQAFFHIVQPTHSWKAPQSSAVLPAPRDRPLAPATGLGILQPKPVVLLLSPGGHQYLISMTSDGGLEQRSDWGSSMGKLFRQTTVYRFYSLSGGEQSINGSTHSVVGNRASTI